MRPLRVTIASESTVSVQGHGVHTAYVEMVEALKKRSDLSVRDGSFRPSKESDIVHLHTVGPRVWPLLFSRGPKKVISAHVVPDSFVGSLVGARWWRPVAAGYLRWLYNRADLLIAVSPATADDLTRLGVKTPVTIIDNAIDTSRYRVPSTTTRSALRKQLGITDDAFVVIGAGQVQPRKRVDCFIRAAVAHPEMHFVWVGGMPFGAIAADHAAMQKMIDTAPANVHFPGIVALEIMPAYYQAADAFWLPSIQETFGLVVVEAAASGLPIILRDIHDYDATFRPYACMVDDNSDVAMLERLKNDTGFYQESVAKAGQLANRYDSVQATEQLVGAYRALVQ